MPSATTTSILWDWISFPMRQPGELSLATARLTARRMSASGYKTMLPDFISSSRFCEDSVRRPDDCGNSST